MKKNLVQLNSVLPALHSNITKRQINELAEKSVANAMEDGNVFPLAEAIAVVEEFAKTIRKSEPYIQCLRDELQKHNGRLTTGSGSKIELCEAGVRYDYSNHPEWRILDEQIAILEKQKKNIEEKLKKIESGKLHVDTETGEVIEGALRKSKSTYRITLAK
ncbi:MAG TPA: hypothetical protein VGO09_00150 [Flavisolibacter sp.]|nr:hypothetical protein [Flavisolibacter sp.]